MAEVFSQGVPERIPEPVPDPTVGAIERSNRIDLNSELARVQAVFKLSPEADTVRCSFFRDENDGLFSKVDVTVRRDESEGILIMTRVTRYLEALGAATLDPSTAPYILKHVIVAIGSDGFLVRAFVEDPRAVTITDRSSDVAAVRASFDETFIGVVSEYANGKIRGGGATLRYEKMGTLLTDVDLCSQG